jgi:asparagine synthase (glutamine-hydrolysing)
MCGITGWIDWNSDLTKHPTIIENMMETLSLRGPDAAGTWITTHCALGHRRLSVIDPDNGKQPMIRKLNGYSYVIVYNGELYNAPELRHELQVRGHPFTTYCDTEVLLNAFVEWGPDCLDRLNGIFAFGVWNDREQSLFLARDRVGVKPLFYSYDDQGMYVFGSEPKAILAHPKVQAAVGREGLAEIFALGPARTPGHGIYHNVFELKPGNCMMIDRSGLKNRVYWQLISREHEDDLETTTVHVKALLQDTVERQLVSDVPICTLLSGGLDSSALTAIASDYYRSNQMEPLQTYSVDYVDNDIHFKESDFQPNADAPWIKRMSAYTGTIHHDIVFDTPELIQALDDVVLARDLPGMADVDASLLLFCREIKKGATVAISGEAADEIFGGYPWFHREESLQANTFPWALGTRDRVNLFAADFNAWIQPNQYVANRYEEALAEVPRLASENVTEARMREMSYLNITRFMPTLLDRKDRMSMAVGLEVRVPYCDHRLIEYVWNIPWGMKNAGNRAKGILRQALEGILPYEVLTRRKSPYPKTHNPNYLAAMKSKVLDILDDSSSPILPFIDAKKIRKLADLDASEFNLPWFGQLMTGPQLFAYLYQINYWLKEYKITILAD